MLSGVLATGLDFERLEAALRVLSHASRLELLLLLRTPKTLDEIILAPRQVVVGENPDRPITRQAVQNHLGQLMELGVVRVRPTNRKGKRTVQEFVVDHAKLFAVTEELRQVGKLDSLIPLDPSATVALQGSAEHDWEPGPKLVLVHGVREGRAFALRHVDLRPPRGWIVGRGDGCQVRLDYDPYVSKENCEITRAADGSFRLLELRTARNGTYLNWRRLPVGAEVALRSGDTLGVGLSRLVFRDA